VNTGAVYYLRKKSRKCWRISDIPWTATFLFIPPYSLFSYSA